MKGVHMSTLKKGDPELAAMRLVLAILRPLSVEARERIATWVEARLSSETLKQIQEPQ